MIAGSLVEGIWEGLFGKKGLFVQLYDSLFYGTDDLLLALHGALFGGNGEPLEDFLIEAYEGLFGGGSNPGAGRGAGGKFGSGIGGGSPEIPKRRAGFGGGIPKVKPRAGSGGGMSTEGYEGNTGGIHITQNIYSQAMSAADIMEEALFRQREAILFGV